MSTQLSLSKIASAIIFISGAYLFFVTLVIAPYINLTLFSSFHTITKVLMVVVAAVISGLQLLFLVPSIRKRHLRNIDAKTKLAVSVSLIGIGASILFSSSLKTSLLGMFTTWESNLFIWLCYALLFVAWTTYFLVLKKYSLAKTVFHTLLLLAILVAIIYSLGEYYWWKPDTGYISQSVARISLGFRNPLFAAYFLGMLWSYSFARAFTNFVHPQQKLHLAKNAFFLVIYSGITFSLLLTFTRSALIMAGVTAASIVLLQLFRDFKNKSGFSRTLVTTLILLAIAGAAFFTYRKEFSLRNNDLTSESLNTLITISTTLGKDSLSDAMDFYQRASQYSSTDIRLLEWQWGIRTWTGSVKNMLVGIGPDAGFFEMPKYRDPVFNNFPTDSATKPFYVRSLYINTLMQVGIFATLGIAYLVAILIKRLASSSTTDIPAFSIILGFLLQGIFYYPTHLTVVLLLFVGAYLVSQSSSKEYEYTRHPNTAERLLLLLIVLAIGSWGFIIAKAEYIINVYGQAAIPAQESVLEQNAKLPLNNNVLKRFLVYHYPTNEQALMYLGEIGNSNDLDDLRIAADAYYVLAKKTNDPANARYSANVLEHLISIDSTLPSLWDSLGLRYLFMGDFSKATQAFKKALELKPDYWYSYMHLGETTRQQCNPEAALEWYRKAEQYIPTAESEIQEAQEEIKSPREECK